MGDPEGTPATARLDAPARNSDRRFITLGVWHEGHATTVRLSTSFSNWVPHSEQLYS